MSHSETTEITQLLHNWTAGDPEAAAQVMPLVYGDLRRIAASYSRQERPDHTLQPTALVHEAYLKLFGERPVRWQSRTHFLNAAARVMRHILVDYSRRRGAHKRGGSGLKLSLSGDDALPSGLHWDGELSCSRPPDLVALDEALEGLARVDPEGARLVELRFFGGLSIDEAAECLAISRTTAVRRWRQARAWLYAELTYGNGTGDES